MYISSTTRESNLLTRNFSVHCLTIRPKQNLQMKAVLRITSIELAPKKIKPPTLKREPPYFQSYTPLLGKPTTPHLTASRSAQRRVYPDCSFGGDQLDPLNTDEKPFSTNRCTSIDRRPMIKQLRKNTVLVIMKRAPFTKIQLRAIQDHNIDNADAMTLLREIKRLHGILNNAWQVFDSLPLEPANSPLDLLVGLVNNHPSVKESRAKYERLGEMNRNRG